MDKRYQIFISSTFADLIEERRGIMEAVTELGCFPAGMEMFPATDMEQFEYIRTVIDESDYYVLVIAGRYGSVAEDGISYTEKEFDYAIEKGIPVLAFIKKDIDSISVSKTDQNMDLKEKLNKFREKAFRGRLGKTWNSAAELKYEIHSSLSKEFKIHPRTGWIRGDELSNKEAHEIIEKLKNENNDLKSKLIKLEEERAQENHEEVIASNIELKIEKNFKIDFEIKDSDGEVFNLDLCIKDIIVCVGLHLMGDIEEDVFGEEISKKVIDPLAEEAYKREVETYITQESLEIIEKKLLALDLVDFILKDNFRIFSFTEKGKQVFMKTVEI